MLRASISSDYVTPGAIPLYHEAAKETILL